MKKVLLAVLAAAALSGCAAKTDTTYENVGKFRAERNLIDRGYQRCKENVDAKYHEALFSKGHLEGVKRAAALDMSQNEKAVCKINWERKAQALWAHQPADVLAYYEARRKEIHAEIDAINAEAER
ncbi:hypothetical protein Q6670_004098 [Salmonella enterica]|nr:hypothetical protein [Salmonella enterica]